MCYQYQNVGIGYINPKYKLQVDGDAGFGSIRIGNVADITSWDYKFHLKDMSTTSTAIRLEVREQAKAIDVVDAMSGEINFRVFGSGDVYARDIKVRSAEFPPTPDYVFEKDYDLLPLPALEKYLIKHKHLPEIPSAKDVERDGYSLGNMNILLLKKVEELTLYVVNP